MLMNPIRSICLDEYHLKQLSLTRVLQSAFSDSAKGSANSMSMRHDPNLIYMQDTLYHLVVHDSSSFRDPRAVRYAGEILWLKSVAF